jgi:hypothetical protein
MVGSRSADLGRWRQGRETLMLRREWRGCAVWDWACDGGRIGRVAAALGNMASCAGSQSCICTILRAVESVGADMSMDPDACDASKAVDVEPRGAMVEVVGLAKRQAWCHPRALAFSGQKPLAPFSSLLWLSRPAEVRVALGRNGEPQIFVQKSRLLGRQRLEAVDCCIEVIRAGKAVGPGRARTGAADRCCGVEGRMGRENETHEAEVERESGSLQRVRSRAAPWLFSPTARNASRMRGLRKIWGGMSR